MCVPLGQLYSLYITSPDSDYTFPIELLEAQNNQSPYDIPRYPPPPYVSYF